MSPPQQHAWVQTECRTPGIGHPGRPDFIAVISSAAKLQACPTAWQETSDAGTGTAGSSAGRNWLTGQGDQHCGEEWVFLQSCCTRRGIKR